LLKEDLEGSVLVFTRTKRGADRVVRDLEKVGMRVASIHGDKSQTARQRALQDFKNGRMRVLVATDIAARGIDISSLPYVVNYDVPESPETYVHRIGRTGRAGNVGVALTLATPEDRSQLRDIEKLIKMRIPAVRDHPFE
jgi:ATP-dependent RNA helicase RhlE